MQRSEMGRRAFLGAAAAAMGAAALGASGCGGKRKIDPAREYLPIGSVVKLVEEDSPILQMIVQRRPITNVVRDRVTGEYRGLELGVGEPYDYAAVRWPYGLTSNTDTLIARDDVPQGAADGVVPADNNIIFAGDLHCFNMEDIKEVVFVGYDDGDAEPAIAAKLNAAEGTPETGIEAMAERAEKQNAEVREARK